MSSASGFGRRVSADNIGFLVEKKLRPLGVLAAADGSSPRLRKADPLLALKYRTALVPAPAVQRLARVFAWLFSPLVLCSRSARSSRSTSGCSSSTASPPACARRSTSR